jgi:hypothetical protein
MKNSSRQFVRTACAVALVLSCGIGIAAAQPAVIIERGVMPAPRVEVIPVAPGPGYNWVPGHWAWRERGWVWIAGHHIRGVVAAMPAEVVEVVPARPSPGHIWVKGHHVFERDRWVWHPGVWVR